MARLDALGVAFCLGFHCILVGLSLNFVCWVFAAFCLLGFRCILVGLSLYFGWAFSVFWLGFHCILFVGLSLHFGWAFTAFCLLDFLCILFGLSLHVTEVVGPRAQVILEQAFQRGVAKGGDRQSCFQMVS